MSLITRCPACGTMFKVVPDQLKVSQGWVRCGHCAEVFDASLHLLPGDTTQLPPSALMPDPLPETPVDSSLQNTDAAPFSVPVFEEPPSASDAEPWSPGRGFADRVPLKPSLVDPDDRYGSPQDAPDSAADFDPIAWKQASRGARADVAATLATPPAAVVPDRASLVHVATREESGFDESQAPDSEQADSEMPDAHHDVSFVREARRKAFWRRPLVRAGLFLVLLLLLAGLLVQWALQQRDLIAATEPRLAPALRTLCGVLKCEVRVPRQIEALVIDSSSFNRIGADAYRLTFTLKNTGNIALEMPALEVTLTDTQDRAVVRRILTPAQFGATSATLGARAETAGLVNMKVAAEAAAPPPAGAASAAVSPPPPLPLRVAGYRVLAFYP